MINKYAYALHICLGAATDSVSLVHVFQSRGKPRKIDVFLI